jgi:Na+-transporting methylmalonyl-CoA/oxaloacetate decarboxylase gamma subunit
MVVDWGQALDIGVKGFGVVFIVLVVLAVAVLLVGLAIRRIEAKKDKLDTTQKGG